MQGVEIIENVDEYKYLGVEINAKGNMFKSFENRILRSLKNKASAIKMKTTEGYDRKEIGDALWNYVGLGGSLFSCEVACLTKKGIQKIENIHNEMGRWLIHASRGIPNVAIRGELGWTNIYTKIAMRKLDYAKRILQLNENNWTRLIFEYIIQQDICTKWRKEILNLRINMEINNNESIRSQILGWHEKEWIKEVEEKSTLKYYNKKWTGKSKKYLNGSGESQAFFKFVTNSLVGRIWDVKKMSANFVELKGGMICMLCLNAMDY